MSVLRRMPTKNRGLFRQANRRSLAAAAATLALFLQLIAPHLPMPIMGGATSWEIALQQLCTSSGQHPDRNAPDHRQQHRECPVCSVVQQAGSVMAPAEPALVRNFAELPLDRAIVREAQTFTFGARAFLSRAPPLAA